MRQRRPRQKSASYLDFIRSLSCAVCGDNTSTEAAHIRFADPRAAKRQTGKGEKSDDRWAIPLCGSCHGFQHQWGEEGFWFNVDRDPIFLALVLQTNAGDAEACENAMEAMRLK